MRTGNGPDGSQGARRKAGSVLVHGRGAEGAEGRGCHVDRPPSRLGPGGRLALRPRYGARARAGLPVSVCGRSGSAGARRIVKRGEQLTVQVGVGVQAAALIARMSSGPIGESAARFLDEENPRRVIPDVVALDQEAIDLATNELDEREGACRLRVRTRREAGSGRVVQSIEPSISQHRRGADFEALGSAFSRGQDDSKEPPPRVAHQQRPSAGAVTTAISVLPATSSAM